MNQTLAILWNACGAAGVASAMATVAAVVLLVAGLGRKRRWSVWLLSVAAAVAAVVLATLTSHRIRSIEVDRSADVQAAEAAAAKTAQERFRDRAAGIRFAEDTAADQADVAGVTAAEEEGAYARAVAEQLAKLPAYARGGRKERSQAPRSGARPAGDDVAKEPPDQAPSEAAPAADAVPPARALPEAQLVVADRFDRWNRGLAWSLLTLATGLVVTEYVRRFNTTYDAVWPLPLAGTPVDGAAAKQHVADPPPVEDAADFLAAVARKGESFVVFAAHDPLHGRTGLPRLAAGPLRWDLPVQSFAAEQLATDPCLAELVFETAWFGRGGLVVVGGPAVEAVIADFADRLERRRACRAVARRTVNVLWIGQAAPAPAVAARVARLAAPTNIRWLGPT